MPSINKALARGHAYISGEKIHGINFRARIKRRADKYGVSGFAKNHIEFKKGNIIRKVEVALEGERWAVLEVRKWIELGKIGKVTNLTRFQYYSFEWRVFTNEFKGREFEIR